MNKKVFIAVDANETGKIIERAILCSELEQLREFSGSMVNAIKQIELCCKENGGEVYMAGGDNVLAYLDEDKMDTVIEQVRQLNATTDFKFSIGIAYTSPGVLIALKYAKANGVDVMVYENEAFCRKS